MALRIFQRIVRGLKRTRDGIAGTLQGVVGGTEVDEEALEELEAGLLSADLGPELSANIIDEVRVQVRKGTTTHEDIVGAVKRTLLNALPAGSPVAERKAGQPHVIFVVGINGGGKTTTVGKLAARERAEGRSVIVAAADTFRAAAIEQLETWTQRAGVTLVKQRERADPAAVVFDALGMAVARNVDTVIVDTAGRLHTKTNLMAELEKLGRVATRQVENAPHEVLLVVDATTGQNGLVQAEEFTRATNLSGVVLTKLDGTAKGGVALGIHKRLGLPIRYVGVGETLEDLLPFEPESYVDGLLGESAE
ncbi:MAG: signal recognition particle-docking protein FtsY [Acidobacteriota bacterium]|nr:signal recognition particle-docking protein FtsY [Acidobacteriota bacterium]